MFTEGEERRGRKMKQPTAAEPTDVGARTKNNGPEFRTQNYAR
jgi:hypothetical protein